MGKIPTKIKVAIPIFLFGFRLFTWGLPLLLLLEFLLTTTNLPFFVLMVLLAPAMVDLIAIISLAATYKGIGKKPAKWIAAVALVLGMAPLIVWNWIGLNMVLIDYKYSGIFDFSTHPSVLPTLLYSILIMVAFAAPII
ncbi:MAG: hypothetical protein NT067_05340, partial [Candidatus Diapherotrites archaeon]|nr:hypothetical protein [Candidatus Diapherotrites archaeon]